MATGHGGARTGAGRKNKPLADKILEGNPGKRKLTVLEFPDTPNLTGEDMPPARGYLSAVQKDGKSFLADEVYAVIWNRLNECGCANLIPVQMIEQYAMAVARWIQCEEYITEYGFLAKEKPGTKNRVAQWRVGKEIQDRRFHGNAVYAINLHYPWVVKCYLGA